MTSTTSIAMWRSTHLAMPVCRPARLGHVEAVTLRYANQPLSGQPVPAVPM